MGAAVDTLVLPGAGHGIVAEEVSWLRQHLNDTPMTEDRMDDDSEITPKAATAHCAAVTRRR